MRVDQQGQKRGSGKNSQASKGAHCTWDEGRKRAL